VRQAVAPIAQTTPAAAKPAGCASISKASPQNVTIAQTMAFQRTGSRPASAAVSPVKSG